MEAGTKYNLTPEYKPEELYRVETGVRKSGPWRLDISNLVVGSVLPVFTPVQADYKKRTIVPLRNFRVVEAYTTGDTALPIKVEKGSLAYIGMFIGSGKKGAEVTAIDKTNKAYDVLTIKAAFGENIAKDAVLFEATAVASEILIEALKGFEGCRLRAYKCPAGVWTIGYGHTKGVKDRLSHPYRPRVCYVGSEGVWGRCGSAGRAAHAMPVRRVGRFCLQFGAGRTQAVYAAF